MPEGVEISQAKEVLVNIPGMAEAVPTSEPKIEGNLSTNVPTPQQQHTIRNLWTSRD